jgi:hypothetical protein
MNEEYELRKHGADKIVFLGIFIISISIAWLIVKVKSTLEFSKPIELPHSGLSLVIPTGKGWLSTEQWQYFNNSYLLSSILRSGKSAAATVSCRYLINTQDITPEMLLNQDANDPNNTIIEKNRIQKGNLTISWVHLERPFTRFLGTVNLPLNRTVIIEVNQTTFEIDVAEKIFKTIIDSINYKEDNPVKAGIEIVTQIKNVGVDTLLDKQNGQACYFIRDSANRNIGFTIDLLDVVETGEESYISGSSHLFSAGNVPQRQDTMFRADKNLRQYILQSQTDTRTNRTNVKINLDESGTIYVISQNRGRKYPDSSNVIPSIFIELLIRRIAKDKIQEAVIDIIDSDGRISSVLFSLKPEENSENISNVVSIESLDGRGFSETFYLDGDNRITKAVIHEESGYYLEKTDIESIQKEFPGQTDFISQQNQFPENDIL